MNKEIPTLNEMLKLYSKKDLWDRIQDKNQIIKQKDQQIAELKKALELACRQLKDGNCAYCKYKDYQICPPNYNCADETVEYFLDKAKEMLKDETNRNI